MVHHFCFDVIELGSTLFRIVVIAITFFSIISLLLTTALGLGTWEKGKKEHGTCNVEKGKIKLVNWKGGTKKGEMKKQMRKEKCKH